MDIAVASMIDNGQVAMDIITLMKQKPKNVYMFEILSIRTQLYENTDKTSKYGTANITSQNDTNYCDINCCWYNSSNSRFMVH